MTECSQRMEKINIQENAFRQKKSTLVSAIGLEQLGSRY